MCYAGLMAYMTTGASNLFLDTLSVSKLAMLSAAARVGRLFPRSRSKCPGGEGTAACGHEGLAQSASLCNGDGFVAEEDAYLISGGSPQTGMMAKPSGDSSIGFEGLSKASGVAMDPEIESGSFQQELSESSELPSAATSAAASAAAHPSSTDMLTDSDRRTVDRDASQQVTNLGMAAVAVNEAEVSLGEMKLDAGGEQGPGPLAPGVSLPADVIDDFIAEEAGLPREGAASPGPDAIAAAEGESLYCCVILPCNQADLLICPDHMLCAYVVCALLPSTHT